MEIDDFLGLLAKARYIQEIEVSIIQRGVVDAFGEEWGGPAAGKE